MKTLLSNRVKNNILERIAFEEESKAGEKLFGQLEELMETLHM